MSKKVVSMVKTVLQPQVLHCTLPASEALQGIITFANVQIYISHWIQAGNYITGSSRLPWVGPFNN